MGKFLYALWLIRPQVGKLQIIHDMILSIDVKCGACCGVQTIFYHKFLIITHCTNLEFFCQSLLEKNIIATKMKENG
jgi:hypothetical protein